MVAGTVWKTFDLCILQQLSTEFALINLVKQNFHIKYGFDKVTYQILKACAF